MVQAWTLLLLMEIGLRLLPFSRLHAFASNVKKRSAPPAPDLTVSRLAWLVEVAARFTPVNATCLKKALVLCRLLGRRGIASTLQIGVARCEGNLAAHAWLESGGQVVFGEREMNAFSPLVSAR